MGHYSASLTKGSLKVGESRIIARLLMDGVEGEAWHKAIREENVLQKRSPSAASTTAEMIAHRLRTMKRPLWQLVAEGSPAVATQAVLAAAIKHNPLIGDFLLHVVREQRRLFRRELSSREWDGFVHDYLQQDEQASKWTAPVLDKLRQNLFRILAEGGYISDTKTRLLQTVILAGEVSHYLEEEDEPYVLRCLRVSE